MIQSLVVAAWFVVIVYATIPAYWLLVHPLVGFWRRRGASLLRVGPLWLMLWVVAGVITWRWVLVFLYRTPWSLAALALVAAGLFIYSRARREFSTDQVLGRSELEPEKHEQRLVMTGIRGRVRHPYYLGHLLNLTGLTLAAGSLAMVYLAALAYATFPIMITLEERELEGRFGEEYREYQKRVPAIFPKAKGRGKKAKDSSEGKRKK